MPYTFATVAVAAALALGFSAFSGAARAAEAPAVAASIAPIHSLAAQVMEGVGAPRLLLPPGASEHTAGLRPSDARALSEAALVIWVGPTLETALARPVGALAKKARVLELGREPGLALLPIRRGGAWEEHDHDHGHGHSHGHDHSHGQAKDAHGHGHAHNHGQAKDSHGQGHAHGAPNLANADAHIWLDPDNAKVILRAVARELAALDPAHADRYAANAAAAAARLDVLDRELAARLAPVKSVPYVVFHDAYQYFERHYGLAAVGSVTLSPDRAPGAQRLIELRARIREAGAACVFSEPQFEPRLVNTLIEGTNARTGVLDPLGAALAPGPEQYGRLMRDLAAALAGCLGGA